MITKLKIINFVKWCLRYKDDKVTPYLEFKKNGFKIEKLILERVFNSDVTFKTEQDLDDFIRRELAEKIVENIIFKKEVTRDIVFDGKWHREQLTVRVESEVVFIDMTKT